MKKKTNIFVALKTIYIHQKFNLIIADTGKVDIVVCNAAILHFAHCLELNDNQIQTALSVNVSAEKPNNFECHLLFIGAGNH